MSKLLVLCLSVLSIVACKAIETPNGEIPAEYMAHAQTFVGTYVGDSGETMTVQMIGRRPVLQYKSGQSNDILGQQCQSQIGMMQKMSISDSSKINSAVFAFSPGYCVDVAAKNMIVTLHENSGRTQMLVEVLLRYEDSPFNPDCSANPGFPYNPPVHCPPQPPKKHFLTKSFFKK